MSLHQTNLKMTLHRVRPYIGAPSELYRREENAILREAQLQAEYGANSVIRDTVQVEDWYVSGR